MTPPLRILGRPSSINFGKVLCTAEEAGVSFAHETQWGASDAPDLRKTGDSAFSPGAYVAGDIFTLADIVVGLSAHRWRSTPIDHAPAPAVRDWLDRLDARAPLRRWTNFP